MLRDTRTIHQNVHAAEFIDGCVYHGKYVLWDRDICLKRNCSPPKFADLFGCALRVFDIEVASRYIAARFRETESDRFAKPNSSAGNERHAPAEIKQFSNVRFVSHDSRFSKLAVFFRSATFRGCRHAFE